MRLYALVFDVSWALAMLLGLDGSMVDGLLPGWAYLALEAVMIGIMAYSGHKLYKLHNQ